MSKKITERMNFRRNGDVLRGTAYSKIARLGSIFAEVKWGEQITIEVEHLFVKELHLGPFTVASLAEADRVFDNCLRLCTAFRDAIPYDDLCLIEEYKTSALIRLIQKHLPSFKEQFAQFGR